MPARKGLLAPQNNFLDTIATRFDGTHSNFVLGNAQVPSLYPIVYCSDGFCELTGYARAQIMQKGCACCFLYGENTKEEQKKAIEKALQDKTELKLEVIFYRRNGDEFLCLLDIVPIKNEKHDVVLYLASHKDITKTKSDKQTDDGSGGKSVVGTGSSGSGEDQEDEEIDEEDVPTKNQLYQRRRSRAVLYQLSGHYRKSVSMKGKLKLKNNLLHSSSLPEYKAATIKKPFSVISHYGLFKTVWDWLILIATFYVAIAVPYSVAFRPSTEETPITIYSDVLVEIVFIIDILINFKTTFVNKKGEVVTDSTLIIKHYLQGWFFCDLLAGLPFDLLYAFDLYSRNTLIHLLKLTRLVRLVRLYSKMDRYSQYSYIILILLMLIFSLISHWLACVWYIIAAFELDIHPDWEFGWIRMLASKVGPDVYNDTMSSYVTALYFTTSSLTSVGFGNVSANTNIEKIFSVFVMLVGALMHAAVFGNVTAIIQRMYARRSQYQTKLRDLKDFFRLHQIPKQLKQRMTEFFQTTWSLNHGIEANDILKEFPDELRGDVSLHMHREMLSLPIFETAPQGCLKLLSRHIRSIFSAPEEYLVHDGDALNYIYLVCNGSMEILQNQMVVAILGKGDLVGCNIPFSLTSESLIKSTGDVKALTYCDLKSIQISGLLEVLRLYPEFAETFCDEIIHDLTFNLREGFDCDADSNDPLYGYGQLANRDDDEDDEDEELDEDDDNDNNDDRHDGHGNEGGSKEADSEEINKQELDDGDDSNQKTNKPTKSSSDNQEDNLRMHRKMSNSQDIVSKTSEQNEQNLQIENRLRKRCSLDKVGSLSSLNELRLQNRYINSADRLELGDASSKFGQLRMADDDTNEDEEEDNSIASCPPTTQPHASAKSLLISKLKPSTKLISTPNNKGTILHTESSLGTGGESSPPDTVQNKRKFLQFNTSKLPPHQQELPPAFRQQQRKAAGYNLLSRGAGQDRLDRFNRAAGVRLGQSTVPRKALRFSQQLNSSGSSTGSPIFNSFAERRAQFANYSTQFNKAQAGGGGRRNSGASIHSLIYDQDSATAAAVQAVHESTANSLERMDVQLHGLGDEVYRLSSDVKLTLYLLKQMCDLATVSLASSANGGDRSQLDSPANQDDNQSNQLVDNNQSTKCNCNLKLIEQLRNISSNIELNVQSQSTVKHTQPTAAKQTSGVGILKHHKKRSFGSNSSQSLTDMFNENRLLVNQPASQQRVKINTKLEKCASHSTLSLPINNSPPSKQDPSKLNFSTVRFGNRSTINQIKELNEFKSGEIKQIDDAAVKQPSLEEESISRLDSEEKDNQGMALSNVRHSWNSLSQFADTSSPDSKLPYESIEIDKEQDKKDDRKDTSSGAEAIDLSAHLSSTIQPISSTQIPSTISSSTQQSNDSSNLSCAIDIEGSPDNSITKSENE